MEPTKEEPMPEEVKKNHEGEPLTSQKVERMEVAENGEVYLTDHTGQMYLLEYSPDGGMTWQSVCATKVKL